MVFFKPPLTPKPHYPQYRRHRMRSPAEDRTHQQHLGMTPHRAGKQAESRGIKGHHTYLLILILTRISLRKESKNRYGVPGLARARIGAD
jgi:hypothetical protein